MIKTEFVAKAGFEDVYDLVVAKKEAFETELEEAKAKAIEEVEKTFEARKEDIDKLFSDCAYLVEVEVEDEEETEAELEETTAETVYVA